MRRRGSRIFPGWAVQLDTERLPDNRSNKLLQHVTAMMVPRYANHGPVQHVSRTVGRVPLVEREVATRNIN